jgi:hypothetical protein
MNTNKRIFVMLFASALVASGCRLSQTPAVENKAELNNMSNKKLKLWYEAFNDNYFDSKLPVNTSVRWGNLSQEQAAGQTTKHDDGSFSIVIDVRLNPSDSTAAMTLAHEECHVATWEKANGIGSHGVVFESCMKGLAAKGAFEGIW